MQFGTPVSGCSKLSEGCRNCYAEKMSKRLAGRCGYPLDNPFQVTLHPDKLEEPLKWKKPRRIFVNSMSDLFHEDVPFEFIGHVFAKMHNYRQHIFMILTKRPERMKKFIEWYKTEWLAGFESAWPREYHHIWLGVSVEDQAAANKRIPLLLNTPAAVRFVSCEPLIGPVNLERIEPEGADAFIHALSGTASVPFTILDNRPKLDWVIVGGESGPGARPMHPEWVLSLRNQCQASGTKFFFKQWGEWGPTRVITQSVLTAGLRSGIFRYADINGKIASHSMIKDCLMHKVGKKKAGRELDGRTWDEMPVIGGQKNG